jgi:Flp pilus assembly protein TadD
VIIALFQLHFFPSGAIVPGGEVVGMRFTAWMTGLALFLGGCTFSTQERGQAYRDDAFAQVTVGNYSNARDGFEAALRLDPNDVGLMYNIAYCSERLGDTQTAGQYYDECLRIEPNNTTYRHALASMLLRQGRRDDAAYVVRDWLSHYQDSAEAYAEDGWLWHELGDSSRAQGRLQDALEHDPNCIRALIGLGIILEEMDRPERALLLYQQALRIEPNQPDIVRRVAAIQASRTPQPANQH